MNANKSERLFNQAKGKAKEHSLFEKLPAFGRMFKAWREGIYKPRKRNILFAIFALVYLISPLDFDWVAFIGWVDDIAILGFAFSRIMKELDRFLEWENNRRSAHIIDTEAEIVD